MGFPNYAKKLGNLGFFFFPFCPQKIGNFLRKYFPGCLENILQFENFSLPDKFRADNTG